MSVSGAVKLASEYMLNSYSRQELIEAIKTDKNIDFFYLILRIQVSKFIVFFHFGYCRHIYKLKYFKFI